MNDFKIQDRKEKDVSYKKYYFRPNPLKVLISRLVKIDRAQFGTTEIYKNIITALSKLNLDELINYLFNTKLNNTDRTNILLDIIQNKLYFK